MSAPRRWTERLGARLAVLLAIALVPLGLIAGLQSQALIKEARARSEAALLGATRSASASELRAIQRAQGSAEALSYAAPRLVGDLDACIAMMGEVVEKSEVFSFAGFYDTNGDMECSSTGQPFSFGRTPALEQSIRDKKPVVRINQDAPLSGTSVLFAQHPAFDSGGELIGFTSVSVPHSAIKNEPALGGQLSPLMVVAFNSSGDLVTSSMDMNASTARLPRDRALSTFVGGGPVTFTGVSNEGDERAFSVIPLVPDTLYALGTWPLEQLPGSIRWTSLPAWVVPALMWIVSLGVALVAAERLVTRHIKALTRSIVSFASGNRLAPELRLDGAPSEIDDAAEAFDRMRQSILRDEAELEYTVHQKEVLLREVHHRVKNNLQLIASIMNMQARRARSREARHLLRRLQERVMSLATIHQELYQTTGIADVRVDELLSGIVDQIVKMAAGPERSFELDTNFDPIRLTPDQAVPLGLLATEALANSMKYAGGASGRKARLAVSLRGLSDNEVELVIENSIGASGESNVSVLKNGSGLGTQLVEAFVRQLGGIETRTKDDGRFRLAVRFPVQRLQVGEARAANKAVAG